jgi:hypothetical protein
LLIELGFSLANYFKSNEDEEEIMQMKEYEREEILDKRQKQ